MLSAYRSEFLGDYHKAVNGDKAPFKLKIHSKVQ